MKNLRKFTLKSLIIATLVSFGLVSCSDDSDTNGEGKANLSVRMTDAPGDYDAVFIDVQDVLVQVEAEAEAELEGDEDGDGWVSVGNVQAGVYDLLELTGGVTQLLADTQVEAGYVSQMRLVLGSNNTVIVDGEEKPLNTPSAQQSGLKLQVNQNFEAGENYSFLLDFDVDQSVVEQGNGGYSLKPVIRMSAEANAGAVIGTVLVPGDIEMNIQTLARLSNGNVTISAYTDADGNFSLNGVPAGTYKLEIIPELVAGLTTQTFATVEVKPNQTTDMGEINL